jgi:hypothetical protein
MKIMTLFVRHGTERFPHAFDELRMIYQTQLPGVTWDAIVIDNKLDSRFQQRISSNCVLIGGSNRSREFSAWQDGLNYMGNDLRKYDFVNLVTEAFGTLYTAYLKRFNEAMLSLAAGRAAAVGHIDYYNSPVTLLNRESQAWLRTSFVFLPPVELELLGPIVSFCGDEEQFSDDPQSPFQGDQLISRNFQQYLLGWLTGSGTGQGVEWHSRFVLDVETMPLFKTKVFAILNEHMFSIRLRAQGCAMVDATWLATRSRAWRAEGQRLGVIPNWRYQLTERDNDAVPEDVLW